MRQVADIIADIVDARESFALKGTWGTRTRLMDLLLEYFDATEFSARPTWGSTRAAVQS